MKLMKSSLGVMTVAFEPGDLARARTEQRATLNRRVSPELFKLIQENQPASAETPIDSACSANGLAADVTPQT
jgi:hypothetical protein